MSGTEETLEERIESVVGKAMRRFGGRPTGGDFAAVKAIVAGVLALADELGGDKREAPARELPTEPDAVILVAKVRGFGFEPPMLAIRSGDQPSGRRWWSMRGIRLGPDDPESYFWHADEDIQEWLPARVVRDDGDGPRAALEAILNVADDDGIPDDEARELVSNDAREALRRLGVEP